MNVSLKKIDAVSSILKVEIEKSDYTELWNKNLRNMRQKAVMPGFRKGMVPFGLVKKMYGKQLLIEEVSKLVSDSVSAYLRDNQIHFLGEPIPNETEQKRPDYDTDENFDYYFDIAMSPEFDIELSKDDKVSLYRIKIEDEDIDKQVDMYRKNFGSHENAAQVEAEDLVKGTMVELVDEAPQPDVTPQKEEDETPQPDVTPKTEEDETPQPDVTPQKGVDATDGIIIEDAVLMPSYLKGKSEQKKFIKAKAGDTVVFNPYKAYKGAEAEIASLLKIDKSAVNEMKSDFSFEIKEITRFVPAALNQELFDKVFGKDAVQNETDFREQIKNTISIRYHSQTDLMLRNSLHDMLIQKTGDIVFADDILKRWLLFTNEKMTKETIENDFPKIVIDLKSQLAKRKMVETYALQVTKEEIEMMARRVIRMQLAQYGLYSVGDEDLEKYVSEMMQQQESVNNLIDRVLDEKIIELMKEKITIEELEISNEEFRKITEEKK